jgi:nicotinamidase-related amidase
MAQKSMQAEPYEFEFDPGTTALVVIDMQRDFVEPGGFGEALGNDVTPLQAVIAPCKAMLDAARGMRMLVIHTREGHAPDLARGEQAGRPYRCPVGLGEGQQVDGLGVRIVPLQVLRDPLLADEDRQADGPQGLAIRPKGLRGRGAGWAPG